MKLLKSPAFLCLTAVIGLAVFIYLLPSYSTLRSIDSRLTRSQVRQDSRDVASRIGLSLPNGLMERTTFGTDNVAITFLQSRAGIPQINKLVRDDSIAVNRWTVVWFDGSQQTDESRRFEVSFSQAGKLVSYRIAIPDSTGGKYLRENEARNVLDSCWQNRHLDVITGINLSDWSLRTSEPIRLERRQDWTFTFVRKNENVFGLTEQISVRTSGDRIISYERSYQVPSEFSLEYNSRSAPFVFIVFSSWVIIFILFAAGLVIFLKRYNEGEAGVGSSLQVSSTYYIMAAISIVLSLPNISRAVQISSLNLFYQTIVVAVAMLLLWIPLQAILTFSAWGIGESSARAQWPEKLFTFDAATHLRFLNEKVGVSILRGFAFSGILLGVYAVAHPLLHIYAVDVNMSTPLDTYSPTIQSIADSFAVGLFCETLYRFGVLSFFGRRRLTTGMIVSAALFIPSVFYELPYGEYQISTRILLSIALSAVMILLFLKYDFLTVLVVSVLFNLAHNLIPIFGSKASYFEWNSVIAAAVLVLPIIISFVALWKKQHFELTVDLMPKHIRRISERERMARELEIAKNVQINLLPRNSPSVPQFEFGGICIPALEVGGDYYDFVRMNNGMIGATIADVSGKGLPAAIYMTLTKGALQAYGEEEPSPRKVLNRINSIIFRSVARGIFISMIYAVIDTKAKKVLFARAGHNPLVYFSTEKNDVRLLSPSGLALGLDNGDKFESSLEEMEIVLKPGDSLIFYTDGFSEAMDPRANEFGEDRLMRLIESTRSLSVKEMLTKIEDEVRKFVSGAPQHDDMTMLVVKVKPD
ncbi:MAG TPA: PP2C family protein-serine/threonine phosphatase [Candidatus Acidoferrales bacterium]|nr:PP2C family protein-serine/threonine phosphatase [Candidatus Acidoferrales bacterium]